MLQRHNENDDEAGPYCALDLVPIQVSTIQSPESSQIPSSTSDSNIGTPTFSTPLNESNNNKNPTAFQTLSHNTRNTNQLESPSKISDANTASKESSVGRNYFDDVIRGYEEASEFQGRKLEESFPDLQKYFNEEVEHLNLKKSVLIDKQDEIYLFL